MPKRIYVGNLPFSASEKEIKKLFEQYGGVSSVSLITDRESARPRTELEAAIVEMWVDKAAFLAIEKLNGYVLDGQKLIVKEA